VIYKHGGDHTTLARLKVQLKTPQPIRGRADSLSAAALACAIFQTNETTVVLNGNFDG